MPAKTREHQPGFKARVALEAYKGDKTHNQLACEHQLTAVQVCQWKKQLLQGAPEIFGRTRPELDPDALTAPLYQEIDRLRRELDWLKTTLWHHRDGSRPAAQGSAERSQTAVSTAAAVLLPP